MTMFSKYISLFLLILGHTFAAQDSKEFISGRIESKQPLDTDTIIFTMRKIFSSSDECNFSSKIVSNTFKVKRQNSYPSLYFYKLKSDIKKGIIERKGDLFFDKGTKKILLSLDAKKEDIDGATYVEYKKKFLPYFVAKPNDIDKTSIELLIYSDTEFDNKLLKYIEHNPNSYVALWSLILAINENGYKSIYEDMLQEFSKEVQKSKLWHQLYDTISNFRLKEGHEFPVYNLKTIEGQLVDLHLPAEKTILIDFWFSRCKPCLDLFPKMKSIYESFKSSNFEIISIATDKTSDIPILKKRINDFSLNWINILDENGQESKKDNINTFPTNFLIENGLIIKKNITLEQLEKYLQNKAEAEKLTE